VDDGFFLEGVKLEGVARAELVYQPGSFSDFGFWILDFGLGVWARG
jgi:hypothetical protein